MADSDCTPTHQHPDMLRHTQSRETLAPIHKPSLHLQLPVVVCPVVFSFTVHWFISSQLSSSRTLILMEWWNAWLAPG